MNKTSVLALAFAGLSLLAGADTAWAQQEGKITDFSRPGRPTMMIYVWGTASTPGIWKVERDVDLIEWLSAAQVPNFANLESTNKQTLHLRIYRPTGARRVEIFESEMKKLLTTGKEYPSLQEGDVLMLETITKQRFNIQTIFSAVAAAASIVLLVIRLDQLSR
jgi:hypothetical protein